MRGKGCTWDSSKPVCQAVISTRVTYHSYPGLSLPALMPMCSFVPKLLLHYKFGLQAQSCSNSASPPLCLACANPSQGGTRKKRSHSRCADSSALHLCRLLCLALCGSSQCCARSRARRRPLQFISFIPIYFIFSVLHLQA